MCNNESEPKTEDYEENKANKSKKKKEHLLETKNLERNIISILNELSTMANTRPYVINGNRKAAQKAGGPISTRSQFIGVSRNGKAWQALISIRKRKTYIGTYPDERHAALAFDFYSILL